MLRRTEEHKQVQLLAAAVTENLENIEKELAHLTSRTGGEEGKLQALKDQLQQQTAAQDALLRRDLAALAPAMGNVLQAVSEPARPALAQAVRALEAAGAASANSSASRSISAAGMPVMPSAHSGV